MVLAEAGEAKAPRTRQQAMTNTVMKPTVTLFVCITLLLIRLLMRKS